MFPPSSFREGGPAPPRFPVNNEFAVRWPFLVRQKPPSFLHRLRYLFAARPRPEKMIPRPTTQGKNFFPPLLFPRAKNRGNRSKHRYPLFLFPFKTRAGHMRPDSRRAGRFSFLPPCSRRGSLFPFPLFPPAGGHAVAGQDVKLEVLGRTSGFSSSSRDSFLFFLFFSFASNS